MVCNNTNNNKKNKLKWNTIIYQLKLSNPFKPTIDCDGFKIDAWWINGRSKKKITKGKSLLVFFGSVHSWHKHQLWYDFSWWRLAFTIQWMKFEIMGFAYIFHDFLSYSIHFILKNQLYWLMMIVTPVIRFFYYNLLYISHMWANIFLNQYWRRKIIYL